MRKTDWLVASVLALCAVGLVWYFTGETLGPNALNLYNLALAGMLLAYLGLAFGRRWAIPDYAGVYGAYLTLLAFGPDHARWIAAVEYLAAGSLALVLVTVAARPAWFDRWRAPRVAVVASLVPMTAYLVQVAMR